VFALTAAWAFTVVWCFASGHPNWGRALGLLLGAIMGWVAAHQICAFSELLDHAGKLFRLLGDVVK
jgi:hypothetical protein